MKLRSKLLLSATCLLTISVAATATSAYAWFVSNRQASVTINNANVKTDATNLKIVGSSKNGTISNATDTSTTIKSSVVATDISGDGKNFFKPRLSPKYDGKTNFNASKIEEVTSEQKYYHEFSLTFSQTNTSVTTGVYLGYGSDVTSNKKSDLPKAVRIAFSTDDFSNVKLYLAPKGAQQDFYLKKKSDTEVNMKPTQATDVVGDIGEINVSKPDSGYKYSTALPTENSDVTDATTTADKPKNTFYLGNVTTANLTVKIRIWFEGMDSNCVTGNIADDLSATLKFYGVNMDI